MLQSLTVLGGALQNEHAISPKLLRRELEQCAIVFDRGKHQVPALPTTRCHHLFQKGRIVQQGFCSEGQRARVDLQRFRDECTILPDLLRGILESASPPTQSDTNHVPLSAHLGCREIEGRGTLRHRRNDNLSVVPRLLAGIPQCASTERHRLLDDGTIVAQRWRREPQCIPIVAHCRQHDPIVPSQFLTSHLEGGAVVHDSSQHQLTISTATSAQGFQHGVIGVLRRAPKRRRQDDVPRRQCPLHAPTLRPAQEGVAHVGHGSRRGHATAVGACPASLTCR
mmetsp:Transcript_113284/g.360059  ORF Transcript_113284/g.360059 Transcript_113284/m.360059 type:complete len:282 (-) Transcript_113284:38-883(-)